MRPAHTLKQAVPVLLLVAIIGVSALLSWYAQPPTSIELGLSMSAPSGAEKGGLVMPASCPSFEHLAGQCQGASTCDPVTQPPPTWGGNSGQCVASCGALGGTQCLGNGASCPAGTYSRGASYDCDVCCGPEPLAECPMTANGQSSSLTINNGGSVALSWNCTSPSTSSSGLNFSTGGAASGSVTLTPSSSTSYTLQCNAACSPKTLNVTVNNPSISISADPARVKLDSASTITWSSSQVTSCSVTGPGISSSATSGSQSTGPLAGRSTYSIVCQTEGGPISASVVVGITPSTSEI